MLTDNNEISNQLDAAGLNTEILESIVANLQKPKKSFIKKQSNVINFQVIIIIF